ncbi:MAG: class I SAM-dependent methyltransferase [Spirochaetales bacterium]|nr:class I SAM-dependent methyltransferase [Spirochaetales bacterium]
MARRRGIEPNDTMRSAAETRLRGNARCISVKVTAEETTLPASTVDAIVVAQAFHWFDREAAPTEFRRILKGSRLMVILWNDLLRDTPFLADSERLLDIWNRLPRRKSSQHHRRRSRTAVRRRLQDARIRQCAAVLT